MDVFLLSLHLILLRASYCGIVRKSSVIEYFCSIFGQDTWVRSPQ